ncbi:MDR family MFS transporter [Demequina mangrovi]|uniref:Drug resistance transporter, EmrB/QacA subfamily n=1 Tax=Demequina mangrovi TaxID=1043493 RepID=A0A1H6ZDB2_9MICO|nr:MDR family MFS transporter [Demequina mangrovi]SEJ49437.1 drug resistance transporter, EmrB/QacA subfamily [Demequina mangrovi]
MTTTLDAGTEAPASSRSGVIPVFIGLMTAMLLASLSQTIFATALPTIVGELDGVDHMLWVTTAYILASTIMIPVYGKLGDLIGRKGLFISAIAIFIAGSIVGGLAGTMPMLIAARAIQGLGGGGLMILAQAIIADIVPARERGKYMGIMGAAFAVSSVAGPLLGGWFTEGIGWRWGLWINIPLGALAIVMAAAFLHPAPQERAKPRLDIAGMALLAIASTAIVLVTSFGGRTYDWGSVQIIGLVVIAVAAAVAFVLVERRAAEPVMPLHLFGSRTFNLTTVAGMLTGVGLFGVIGYMPTYLQMVASVDATEAGLLTAPMMLTMLVTSTVTGFIVSRTGRYKWYPVIGSVIIAGALYLLSSLEFDTALWVTVSYLALLGLGLGLSMQTIVLMVQNAFPLRIVGTATAANNYFRQVGASLGTAVVGSMFTTRLLDLLEERLPAGALASGGGTNALTPASVAELPDQVHDVIVGAYNDALTPAFLVMMPLAIVGAVLLLFVKEIPLRTTLAKDAVAESAEIDGETAVYLEPHADDAAEAQAPTGAPVRG